MPSSSVIKVIGLKKTFGKTLALHHVDFELLSGEVLAIVGESGSGKTTLARIVSGLEPFDEGMVVVGEFELRPRTRPPAGIHTYIQYIFQHPQLSFDPRYSAMDVVMEPLLIQGRKEEEMALKLLEVVGLEQKKGVMARALSGGEAARLALARALAVGPEVLILDELSSGLDARTANQVFSYTRNLLKSKQILSLVLITHDVRLAQEYSNRCLVLLKGSIVEQGPTPSCLKSPMHPYTQALIDASTRLEAPEVSEVGILQGCPFFDACKSATERCREVPPLTVRDGRTVRCWKYV